MPESPKPYAKINLLSRKTKDKRNLETMKSEAEKGNDYSFTKKSKKAMDVGGGKTAKSRGAIVSSSVKKTPGSATMPKTSIGMTISAPKTTRTYTKETVNTGHPAYGKENEKKEAPDFVKEAQEKKQDIVVKNGLPYRAGRTTEKTTPAGFNSTASVTGKIKITPPTSTKTVSVKEPKEGNLPSFKKKPLKTRANTVDYLKGQKGASRKTEGGYR